MMYPRLKLARNLLSDDGVIFISIDDNEQANLKKICDEIFGIGNFVNCIAVKMSESSGVKMTHVNKKLPKLKEYILMYKKTKNSIINEVKIDKCKWDKEYNSIMLNVTKEEFIIFDNIINSCFSVKGFDYINNILKKVGFL